MCIYCMSVERINGATSHRSHAHDQVPSVSTIAYRPYDHVRKRDGHVHACMEQNAFVQGTEKPRLVHGFGKHIYTCDWCMDLANIYKHVFGV